MRPAGFFVLRTPLLPFEAAAQLSEGLEAPSALDDASRLRDALKRDRARVSERLRTLVQSATIRDAIFVASPDLDLAINRWLQAPDGDRAMATERAVMRYVVRMAARATPFGLFAGSSVGTIGPRTALIVSAQHVCRRHTRLDTDYLVTLAATLARDSSLAPGIRYTPNSSLYRSANGWRYVETRLDGKARSHHLVAVDDSDALQATLERARRGAARAALVAALVDDGATAEDADAFVGELIESQILIADVECPLTGAEPSAHLEEVARRSPEGVATAEVLAAVASALRTIDESGLGAAPESYRRIASQLETLPAKVDLTQLFQVDLVKPAPGASVGQDVIDEISRGVEILRRIQPPVEADPLERFRTAFVERYGAREVPLAEALDEESGVGGALIEGGDRDPSPLFKGLEFPSRSMTSVFWSARETALLHRVGQALLDGRLEMMLTDRDIEALAVKAPPPLPDAYSVMATLIGRGDQRTEDANGFRVLLHRAGGPSGASLLGRFCHADPELLSHVRQHLRDEEALDSDALFAEIVHLPEGHVGNILRRPVLRSHEIVYLGRSGAPPEQQIPVSDLTIALIEDRFVLRSKRLARRIVPRLTSAHNFTLRSLAIYRFLCLLQSQARMPGCSWTWGALEALPFLPRVTCGRLVFSRAVWRVLDEEIRTLSVADESERYRAVQAWRATRHLPRWVVVADYDNRLPIDLDNITAIDVLLQLLKGRQSARLTELYPGPDELSAVGDDGRFVHELVIPFHGHAEKAPPVELSNDLSLPMRGRAANASLMQRTFTPGSEWVYAKLYSGTGLADRLLTDVVGPVSRAMIAAGVADEWFFIRYIDPDDHLRWRVHASPGTRPAILQRRIQAAVAPLVTSGHVRRVAFDTYEREIERYGGPAGIRPAEQWFYADSEAVLDILLALGRSDADADQRWQIAIPSVDALLTDLGCDLEAKRRLMRKLRVSFGREFDADAAFGRQLSAKFRAVRGKLEQLLAPAPPSESRSGWREALALRSARTRPIVDTLQESQRNGNLTRPLADLAQSYVHMHLNRLFRAQQRAHELVIYDFLSCLYEGRLARQRAHNTLPTSSK